MDEVKIPETTKQEISETNIMLAEYEGFKVTTNELNAKSLELCKQVKIKYNALEEARKHLKQPILESAKRIDDLFRQPLENLQKLERIFKSASYTFTEEQERIRQEQEDKLRKLAEIEENRLRKIKEEQERVWREKEEKARLESERLRKEGNAKEAERLRLEAEKFNQKAEERKEESENIESIAPVVVSKVTAIKGASIKTIWRAKIVDEKQVPREYLMINDALLQSVAKATKGSLPIAGVEFFEDKDFSVRTK